MAKYTDCLKETGRAVLGVLLRFLIPPIPQEGARSDFCHDLINGGNRSASVQGLMS